MHGGLLQVRSSRRGVQVASGEQSGRRAEHRWNCQHTAKTRVIASNANVGATHGQRTVERHVVARVFIDGGSAAVSQLS